MRPSRSTEQFACGVVILGAGQSSRMGCPKLLLPWGATTVLGQLIEQWTSLEAAQIAVVCAAEDQQLKVAVQRLAVAKPGIIDNRAPERGMFSSVQCAAGWERWRLGLTHFAVVLGDQPHLRLETLRSILAFSAEHPDCPCQPSYGSRRHHPVLLPGPIFRQIADSPARDLKSFLSAFRVLLCEIGDPGLVLDIDRPEDYQQALRLYAKS